jgi:hypothetical protein
MEKVPPLRRPLSMAGLELATAALLAVQLWPLGGHGPGLGWGVAAPVLAVGVSRWRSRAARWLLTLLYAFGLGYLLLMLGGNPLGLREGPMSLQIVVTLALAQLLLLWLPDTSDWLRTGRRRAWDGSLY